MDELLSDPEQFAQRLDDAVLSQVPDGDDIEGYDLWVWKSDPSIHRQPIDEAMEQLAWLIHDGSDFGLAGVA